MAINEIQESLRVDVEVLKEKVLTLTQLCNKIDTLIEKLVDNNDKMIAQIYQDMEKRKSDTNTDVKELHSRITTISRELSDKVELTERRIMDEIKSLRNDISEHNKKEDGEFKKLLEWRWMVAGGIAVAVWIVSQLKLEGLAKLFH